MVSNRQLFLSNLAQTSTEPLMLEIEKAEGCYLYDNKGKEILDLIAGISVSNLGHGNKEVINAVKTQAEKYMHLMVYGEIIQTPQVKLGELLCSLLPETLNNIYLLNSGSEAVEGALKLAKRYTGRPEIIAFNKAYHGSSTGAMSIMGDEDYRRPFTPLLPGIHHANYNDEKVLDLINEKTACVIVEPIQAEAGIIEPQNNFLKKLREKCNQTGSLLIFDEIQTGFGRTGKFFAFEHFNVIPDIILFAKALGGGMPIGAFVSSKEIMAVLTHNPVLGHITTFGGHPVSSAAALANIEFLIKHKKELIDSAEEKEKLFKSLLKHNKIKEVRGKGLFMAVDLGSFDTVQKTIKRLIDKGVLTDWFLFESNCLRIAPPLIITPEQIKFACNTIIEALSE